MAKSGTAGKEVTATATPSVAVAIAGPANFEALIQEGWAAAR